MQTHKPMRVVSVVALFKEELFYYRAFCSPSVFVCACLFSVIKELLELFFSRISLASWKPGGLN